MYIARKISFMVEMLNSDDNQVRFIARESLQLHMNKRKVNLAKSDDPSFGGYEVNEAGIIKKNSKQCLSKSQWVELNELCARTRIQLLKTNDEFKIVLPGTSQPLQCSNYYKPLYEHLHQKQLSEWMELEFQGAIIRQEAFDMQCSQEIYKNNSLADKLVKFVTKSRLQIAETNTFLPLVLSKLLPKEMSKMQQPKRNHITRAEWMYGAQKTFMLRDTTELSSLSENRLQLTN